MATTGPTATSWRGSLRIACAVLIVVCLSSGPLSALSRWVARLPVALETWPYVYTYWISALIGSALFVHDVVPAVSRRAFRRAEVPTVFIVFPMALGLWAMLSALWTDSPSRTPQQALLMVLVLATAIWFGSGLRFREQVLSVFIATHLLTVASVAAALLLESARFHVDGSWIGLFSSPNSLSPVAGLAVISAIGIVPITTTASSRVAVGLCVVVDLVAVWKASSGTGWVALVAAGAALVLVVLGRRLVATGVRHTVMRGAVGVAVAAAVISIPWSVRFVATRFGKDQTSTGRTVIWDYIFDVVGDRWITGFGYQSFWDAEENRRRLAELRSFRTVPDAAHSSFMEVLLFLGAIGLGLVLILVAWSVASVWWSSLGGRGWPGAWWTAVATFALVENVAESMIAYHSVFWVLLVAAGFAVLSIRERPEFGVVGAVPPEQPGRATEPT